MKHLIGKIRNLYFWLKKFVTEDIWKLEIDDFSKAKRKFIKYLKVTLITVKEAGANHLGTYAFSLSFFSTMSMVPFVAVAFAITEGFGLKEYLQELLLEYFSSEIDELDEKNVCIRILGDKQGLPAPQREAVIKAEERTKDNTGLKLNIAINYGARDEILRAVRALAQKAKDGEVLPQDISEADFAAALYTHDLPDVDLVIRTSGEMRLSNFLLYQCAYAEMVFPKVLWPDFTLEEYHAALSTFGTRDRRFGGRKE